MFTTTSHKLIVVSEFSRMQSGAFSMINSQFVDCLKILGSLLKVFFFYFHKMH